MTVSQPSLCLAATGRADSLVLRPARPADIDSIAAIEAVFPSDRLARRRIRALIAAASARLLVAECDGALAGYALVLLRRGSRVARLYSIAVAEGQACRGTGSRLLAAAEEAALGAGAQALRLEVRADNGRAIALYARRGYRLTGQRPHYYQDGMSALRYEKVLAGTSEPRRARKAADAPRAPAEPSA